MLDLEPAARQMAWLIGSVHDEQFARGTPCKDYTLGDLIEHVAGLSRSFTVAARKGYAPGTSRRSGGDASRLESQWRERIIADLDVLVRAWREPIAWEGMTEVGGVQLPGPAAAHVALGELLVHGWDIARASDLPYEADPNALDAYLQFAIQAFSPGTGLRDEIFGPAVEVSPSAPILERVIAFTGREPAWAPT